jgi:hypothetical protein
VALVQKSAQLGLLAGTRREIYIYIIDPISNYALLACSGVAPFKFKFVDENSSIADLLIGVMINQSSVSSDGALGFAFKPTIGNVYLISIILFPNNFLSILY